MASGSFDEPNDLVEVKEMFATFAARWDSLASRVTNRPARSRSPSLSGCDGDIFYGTEGRDFFKGAWRNAINSELRPEDGNSELSYTEINTVQVPEYVAAFWSTALTSQLTNEARLAVRNKFNVLGLEVAKTPRVDFYVWGNLSQSATTMDKDLAKTQSLIWTVWLHSTRSW